MSLFLFLLNLSAVVTAGLSAWFWFKSATLALPPEGKDGKGPDVIINGIPLAPNTQPSTEWGRTVSKLNSHAAIFSAITAALVAIGLFLNLFLGDAK